MDLTVLCIRQEATESGKESSSQEVRWLLSTSVLPVLPQPEEESMASRYHVLILWPWASDTSLSWMTRRWCSSIVVVKINHVNYWEYNAWLYQALLNAVIMVPAQRDYPQVLSAPGKQPPVPVRHRSYELPFWKGKLTVVAGLCETAGPPPRIFSAQYILARLIARVVWGYHVHCQETCELLTTRHTLVRD